MTPFRRAILVAGIVVAAAGAGTVLVAAATSPSPGPAGPSKPPAICTNFLGHLATDLNTSPANLDAAVQKAIGQTLDDQVKSGKLTQARADALKQRLAGKAPCAIAGQLRKVRTGKIAAYRSALITASASALGVTPDALRADLKKGMSLSQVAAAQKPAVTEAQFRARLIANLTPLLDKAVAEGKLTKARETAILQRLQSGPIPLWNRPTKPASAPTGG